MIDLRIVPDILYCSNCGAKRKVPSYWKDMGLKARQHAYVRLCKRCGSGRKRLHGLGGTQLYMVWYNMMCRCGYKKANLQLHARRNYLLKGIKICYKWRNLRDFYKWAIENGYRKGLWLDRIDNEGNYQPSNCRWVTPTQSSRHTTRIKLSPAIAASIRQSSLTDSALAATYEVNESTIKRARMGRTWW